jgi:hypothetical protein
MKRATPIIMLALLALLACKNVSDPPANGNKEQPSTHTAMTSANDVIEAFKKAGLPIGAILVFTDETDPNKLLNRPNSYIEKADWADARVKQTDPKYPIGGTIEIFKSDEDLQKRKNYIENGPAGAFGNNEYMYIHKNGLIRLRKDLTPAQAKDYEQALNSVK